MQKTRRETVLNAPGPQGALNGTLLSPLTSPQHVVLMIAGSGPTDRDGNNPLGVKASTFRLLAEQLAQNGIATLRADKRGMFASAAAVPDANAVTINDYVDDVRSWITVITRRFPTAAVWLLGHSEGGIVALAAAQEEALRGVILVATPSRAPGAVLKEQLTANSQNPLFLEQGLAVVDALEKGRHVDVSPLDPALQGLFHPAVQGFLIDLFAYHPAQMIAALTKPVLIIQGLRDLQVPAQEAHRLQRANPRAALVLLPDTNHVLKTVKSDDQRENYAAYTNASLPLATGVVEAIAQFLTRHTS
ncbi:alpha/beta hydrolase [Atlantibacter sp.]|uniref:alpha/beta hydrolase n=1 Tax=Atlantibacter sp. TaxID=1903473 RepID=UPI0028A820D1|nr:alpha/beta fold hydrolase [Atlantibacter sp.]